MQPFVITQGLKDDTVPPDLLHEDGFEDLLSLARIVREL